MDLSQNTIAIVDDDSDILLSAKLFLKKYFQTILCFTHPNDLFKALEKENIDAILLDLNYSTGQNDGQEGLAALFQLKTTFPKTEVIMMTAYAEVGLAVEAVKRGAFDFMVKPWQNEKLLVTLMNAVQKRAMNRRLFQQAAMIHETTQELTPILGESHLIEQIRELISQIAPTDATVLIKGETGSGKSLIAQHIHQRSTRSSEVFISIDFSSLPEEKQWESLFGNETSIGKWELAKGGTLFLKEINYMTRTIQEQLLTSLTTPEGKQIRILSSSKENNINQSVLPELQYRLSTIEVNCPSLKERPEDLIELFDYYLNFFKSLYRKPNLMARPLVLEQLKQYAWPGNVRELKRAIERVVVIGEVTIKCENLIPSLSNQSVKEKSLKLEELESQHIQFVLLKNNGNIQQSAAELGLSRAALYRRIEKYNIKL